MMFILLHTFVGCILVTLTINTIGVDSFSASTNGNRRLQKSAGAGAGAGTGFGSSSKVEKKYIVDTSIEIQELYKFLDTNKAEYNKNGIEVGIDPITGRRGLYTTKAFTTKEKIICRIPSTIAIALSDPSKNGIDIPTIAHCGANFISMYLKNSNLEQQQWLPYLNTIPKSIDPTCKTPDLYTNDEISLLEFPKLISKALQRKKDIETVAQEQQLSIEELQYATYIVSTRSFPLAISDINNNNNNNNNKDDTSSVTDTDGVVYDERGQVMTKAGGIDDNDSNFRNYVHIFLPLFDIVNHSSDRPNVRLIIQDAQKDLSWFCYETVRPIPAGTELVRSYGSTVDSSIELLANYGFVPKINPIDTFMLQKGGDGCIISINDWTTTIDEDKSIIQMLPNDTDDDNTLNLRTILQFRIRLKEAYP